MGKTIRKDNRESGAYRQSLKHGKKPAKLKDKDKDKKHSSSIKREPEFMGADLDQAF